MGSRYFVSKFAFVFLFFITNCSLWGQDVIEDLKKGLRDNKIFYSKVIKRKTDTENAVLRLKNSGKSNKELERKYEDVRLAYDAAINIMQTDFKKIDRAGLLVEDLLKVGKKKKEYAIKFEAAEKKRKIFLESAYSALEDKMGIVDRIIDILGQTFFPKLYGEMNKHIKEVSEVMVSKLEACRYKKWEEIR